MVPFFVNAAGLSHIKTNITVYLNTRLQDPKMADWINARVTSLVTNSGTFYPFQTRQYYYLDAYNLATFAQYAQYVDFLNLHGWKYEQTMLHAKTDYTPSINPPWSQADKFDRFENANGVLIETTPGVFTDKTAVAYSGASPYTTVNSNLYIGYELPFDQANIVLKTPGAGVVGTWQYWKSTSLADPTVGVWSDIATSQYTANDGSKIADVFSDGTNNGIGALTQSGAVSFYPPNDWARTTLNGSRNKYFIRFAYSSAVAAPVINTIKGDTWMNSSSPIARGWDATSVNIINAGTELEYNPSPTAGSSAKFPYQARIVAWSNDHFVMNPGNMQSGMRPWSKYLASVFETEHSLGFQGFMDDLGGGLPNGTNNDFVGTWNTAWLAHIDDIVTSVHAIYPDMIIGGNTQSPAVFPYVDFAYQEYLDYVGHPSDMMGILTSEPTAGTYLKYDNYIFPNNIADLRTGSNLAPKFGIMMQADLSDTLGGISWDRANRGPILALAKHYIADNDNTYFEYQTENFYYDYIDEVLLKNGTTVYLADGAHPKVADVAVWRKWFPAIEADIGAPDPNGYNGGVRDLQWITGPTSGDGRADVWRRDFTKAIVILRTAHYQSSDADMSNYYTPIDLGGTFYSLAADGTTGPAITSISLRAGEAAILMKAPLGNDATAPSAPSGLSVQ